MAGSTCGGRASTPATRSSPVRSRSRCCRNRRSRRCTSGRCRRAFSTPREPPTVRPTRAYSGILVIANSRAVNWGGYAQAADVTSILEGSHSELPSTVDDRNTRDYSWRAGAPYRFSIERSPNGWTSSITDVEQSTTTIIRELFAGGDRLGGFVVWSELFCGGGDPHTAVRWSNPVVARSNGVLDRPSGMTVTYPGGREWRRLDTSVDEIGVVQATDTRRRTARSVDPRPACSPPRDRRRGPERDVAQRRTSRRR